jgi:hypothetical protein
MTEENVVTQFRNYLEGISKGTVEDFEEGFADIHAYWHMTRKFQDLPIGFLTLHSIVVDYHDTVCRRNGKQVPPPWKGKNDPPGVPYEISPPYQQSIGKFTNPEVYSIKLENWHNSVHRNTQYPPDFIDPQKNIKMYLFWCWHRTINNLFLQWCDINIPYNEILSNHAEIV